MEDIKDMGTVDTTTMAMGTVVDTTADIIADSTNRCIHSLV
jgi:hypothetical protein